MNNKIILTTIVIGAVILVSFLGGYYFNSLNNDVAQKNTNENPEVVKNKEEKQERAGNNKHSFKDEELVAYQVPFPGMSMSFKYPKDEYCVAKDIFAFTILHGAERCNKTVNEVSMEKDSLTINAFPAIDISNQQEFIDLIVEDKNYEKLEETKEIAGFQAQKLKDSKQPDDFVYAFLTDKKFDFGDEMATSGPENRYIGIVISSTLRDNEINHAFEKVFFSSTTIE